MIKFGFSEYNKIKFGFSDNITNDIYGEYLVRSQSPLLRFDSRSGSELIDSVSGETATILTPCYLRTGATRINGDKTRNEEKVLDGEDYTIYFQFRQVVEVDPALGRDIVSFGGAKSIGRRGIEIRALNNDFSIYVGDGTSMEYDVAVNDCNGNLLDNGFFHCIINLSFTDKELKCAVYDENYNLIGSETNRDISGYVFNSNDNCESFTIDSYEFIIDNIKKFEGIKTIIQCRNHAYVTDLQMHLANVMSAIDISGNGCDFYMIDVDLDTEKKYYQFNDIPLDYGFDLYVNIIGGIYQTVYKKATGESTEPARGIGLPYGASRLIWESEGNSICNLRDAKIRFTNAFFDRSDSTIWNDDCRASDYYDATNTKDFHINELNQRTLMNWLNAGYRGRLYINMNPNSVNTAMGGDALLRDATDLIEIILFTADKTGTINKSILTYTGDIFSAVLDDYGDVTYDDDGYVALGVLKTTKPMFTIRIDDGYQNAYDDWRSFFNRLGINPTMNIHSQLVGTSNGYDFMAWDDIKMLVSEGWEIQSTGQYDNNWNTDVTQAEHEYELYHSKTEIEIQGITCNHLVPNKHGQANMASRYFAKKYGFYTCHCGWEYGDVNGCNPQTIDKFNLCAMSGDLFGIYNLEDADNTEEIAAVKAQLDDAVTNNAWAIIYIHSWAAQLQAALDEIITYANDIGIEIMTMDKALENIAYL